MKKAAGMERHPSSTISVLSIGSTEEDQAALSRIFDSSRGSGSPGAKWILESRPSLASGISLLKSRKTPLVLCESDLGAATWRDFWAQAAALPDPPYLIVTSRLADESLWAEALSLGAYDVLAKPFQPEEVVRALSQAWLRRTYRFAPSVAIGRSSASGVAV